MDATTPHGATSLALPPLKHIPTQNYGSRNGAKVRLIVVHDCEGAYAGSINWFVISRGEEAVSAHYVLREDGLEATQMVDLANKAWHVCDFNSVSVGLELAGFGGKGFGAPEWQTAANIVAFLLHKLGLPCLWAQGGVGSGFCSHFDLGRAGGGHHDPTTDPAVWQHFAGLVKVAYALPAPADWAAAPFVPTPTVRRD